MNDKQFEIISRKLDALIKVAGMAACRGLPKEEHAWLLHCSGLTSPEIAELLSSTDVAIRQAIHRMQLKQRSKPASKRGSRKTKTAEPSGRALTAILRREK